MTSRNNGPHSEPGGSALAGAGQIPPAADPLFAMALAHHQRGQLVEAEGLYRKILAVNPRHADALHFAGVATLQQGRAQDAVKLIEQSLAQREDDAQAHYHLGLALGGLRRFEEAAAHNRRAIALKPDFLDAHTNLGNALKALGRLDEAADCYQRVVAANPKLATAHYNLANVLVDKREFEAAIGAFERALAAVPNDLPARQNYAMALLMLGRLDEAIGQFKTVSAARWDFAEAQLGHALALMQKGNAREALAILCRVLNFNPSADARLLFVECITSLTDSAPITGLQNHLIAALTEPWARPRDLAGFAAAAMRMAGAVPAVRARAAAAGENFKPAQTDLEALAGDRLLLAVLENAAVVDPDLERILAAARRELLAIAAGEAGAAGGALLGFACALARQCFINEYVFDLSDEERGQARALRDRFDAETPSPLMLAVVASYFPLHDVPGADRLLERAWPAALDALLAQQLREPHLERELREAIRQLTPIDDDVSLKVQQQYEENPYPRWVKIARIAKAGRLDDFFRKLLPFAPLQATGKAACDILVAGCGTGQQPLELALHIAGAKVLAVDLSKASLAHAQRKTRELAVDNIDYAQADILKLRALGRTFDFVATSGVLHHMDHPFAAWRDLTALLRPGGLMMLGLYSKTATANVLAARDFVARQGFQSTADGIRKARQAIMALPDGELAKSITSMVDFFSASECRDLLFHVQEQRLTIPQLKSVIDETGVRFLGFCVRPEVVGRYRARFPQDSTLTDLDNWHAFETDNPHTFMGMYHFVLQKPSDDRA